MAESSTTVYIASDNKKAEAFLNDKLAVLSNSNLSVEKIEMLTKFSFEDGEDYTDRKFTKILKDCIASDKAVFIRVRQYDEYGTETYFLNFKGKLKKYQHDSDDESADIVQAYEHWHSEMGNVWDGTYNQEDIEEMSARYGAFDENGKRIKIEMPEYWNIVKNIDTFIGQGLRIPYASADWNRHIDLYHSHAELIIRDCEFKPEGTVSYLRTYKINRTLGFIWTWKWKGKDVYFVIKLIDDDGVSSVILVNHENLTIDELILLEGYSSNVDEKLLGKYDWTHYENYFEHVMPPCEMDLNGSAPCGNFERYPESTMVGNTRAWFFKDVDGVYKEINSEMKKGATGFEIHDKEFSDYLDSLPDKKYFRIDSLGEIDLICCSLQLRFISYRKADLVIWAEVEKGKTFRKLSDYSIGKLDRTFTVA